MNRFSLLAATLVALTLTPRVGDALEIDYVPVEVLTEDPNETPDGWTHTVDLGAGLQLGGSHKVPGQTDGATITMSLQLAYSGSLWRGSHELRLTGSLVESVTRTPLISEFFKSGDALRAESIYFYHLPSAPSIGPFMRASVATSLFRGIDIRPAEVTYLRDGEEIVADRIELTQSFSPTYLKQSAGLFARPVSGPELTIDFRVGAGTRQVFADGSFVLDDDPDTDVIELTALATYYQAGSELATDLHGTARGDTVSYGASFEMMTPFYNSADSELDALEATNYEIRGSFSARMTEWASVQYGLVLTRVPEIIEEWQVTNALLLSFNYGYSRGPADRE